MSEYIPGNATPVSITKSGTAEAPVYKYGIPAPSSAAIRTMTPGEYARYYSYLYEDDNRVGDEVKGAVAIVLKADLIRLYQLNNIDPKLFEDPLLNHWVTQYYLVKSFDSTLYAKALAEVLDFEAYLKSPINVNNPELQEGELLNTYSKYISGEAQTVAKDLRISSELAKQRQKHETKKEIDRYNMADKFSFNGRQAYIEWVKFKFYDYLASIYTVHNVSTMKNLKIKELEYPSRKMVADLVKNNVINAVKGTELYSEILDILITSKSEGEFKKRKEKITRKYTIQHPIMKLF